MAAESVANPLSDLRRVVTGHRGDGVAVVKSDKVMESSANQKFQGVSAGPIWRTGSLPVNDNNDETDGATREATGDLGLVVKGGTNLLFTDLAPGATASMHRTSSLDHNILISGKVILIMEDGSETVFENPGDVVVQRGTMHAWRNPGPEWVRWITVVYDAQPAVVNDVALDPYVE
ncbi:hypothetical protein L227DRAFT_614936 [Lentinus tigrinus ALCF2SS1-6]|uniref:Cupin type-2 domain-containing protein n=1 Tax=Lentinus tigrinus ALCF2SS1-6 TaxID=1328759 RepID=A0A5C2RXL4_9APHY|nr:hypothetical protein L227DRAFT_614936 [Lentinus tigrinus ALCF2SS1-6]